MTLQLRQCSSCSHWNTEMFAAPQGYIESVCEQPDINKSKSLAPSPVWKRASDTCSKWARIKEPGHYDIWHGLEVTSG